MEKYLPESNSQLFSGWIYFHSSSVVQNFSASVSFQSFVCQQMICLRFGNNQNFDLQSGKKQNKVECFKSYWRKITKEYTQPVVNAYAIPGSSRRENEL